MRHKRAILVLAGLLSATGSAFADVDALIVNLAGSDEKARAVARQLIPREGLAAVPKLIYLLRSDDAKVWWPANAALRDILNDLAQPGRGAERKEAAAQVLALLAPEESATMKERALRLVPLAIPKGMDIAPLAALLEVPDFREKAREALGELGTPEAVKALATALETADPEFQVALLNTSVHLKRREFLNAVRPLFKSESPEVRAAAARAVAWCGQASYLGALRKIAVSATPETQFDAADALLRLCDSVAIAGGNYEAVISSYRFALAEIDHPVIQATALVGLGTYGDETVIPEIIAFASGTNAAELQGPALQALEQQTGRAAANVLVSACTRADDNMKVLLLHLFGRKRDPIYLPTLQRGLEAPDAELRQAAVAGLRESGLADAAKMLGDFAPTAAEGEKAAALDALNAMSASFAQAGNAEAAGRTYLGLHHAAATEEQKKAAIEGIKQYPVPESFSVLLNDLDLSQLAGMPVKNLAGLHKALADAQRAEDLAKVEGVLLAQLTSKENTSALIDYARASGTAGHWVGKLGVLTKWQIVGPFPFKMTEGFTTLHLGDPNVDLAAKYTGSSGEVAWKSVEGDPLVGIIDLMGPLGAVDSACAYALAKVNVAEAAEASIRAGSDDGLKIWVNGAPVHENNIDRGFAPDSDVAPIKLNAGENNILVQISQGAGGWNFGARLTKADGTPLAFTQP